MGHELGPEFERGIMQSAGARLSSWDSSCRLSNCTAIEVGRSRNLTQLRKMATAIRGGLGSWS